MVLAGMQSLACAGEPGPAESAAGGATPEPTATTDGQQAGGSSPEERSGLAGKMQALIAGTDDAAAANIALMTFYTDGLSDYEIDEAGVLALGREYLEAGDDARAEVVFSFLQMASFQVTREVSADIWAAHGDLRLARGDTSGAKSMYDVALGTDADHAYSKQRLASLAGGPAPKKPSSAASSPQIARRDDLARFRFKFTEAGGGERTLMISETCNTSGVLRAVAQWENSAPWVFTSVSDTVFEQVNAPKGKKPVKLTFELDPGTAAEAVVVSGGAKGRFEWGGYLPDGFEPEMGTCD